MSAHDHDEKRETGRIRIKECRMYFNRYATYAAITAVLFAALPGLAYGQASRDDGASLPEERSIGHLEAVHEFYGAMPSGVAKAPNGRLFVNYPHWGDDVPYSVGEIVDGRVVPYPNEQINRPDPTH